MMFAIAAAVFGVALHRGSEWWERAFATYESSETSPDGCLRVDVYEPFWLLPSALHRIPSPEMDDRYDLGMRWEAAVFIRAHEISTGDFLGETIVFDPSAGNDFMDWGDAKKPGRRVLIASGFLLADSTRCSDPATLAKLDAFYERQQEAKRTAWTLQNAERRDANPSESIKE